MTEGTLLWGVQEVINERVDDLVAEVVQEERGDEKMDREGTDGSDVESGAKHEGAEGKNQVVERHSCGLDG